MALAERKRVCPNGFGIVCHNHVRNLCPIAVAGMKVVGAPQHDVCVHSFVLSFFENSKQCLGQLHPVGAVKPIIAMLLSHPNSLYGSMCLHDALQRAMGFRFSCQSQITNSWDFCLLNKGFLDLAL
jgi:hypothetical protein